MFLISSIFMAENLSRLCECLIDRKIQTRIRYRLTARTREKKNAKIAKTPLTVFRSVDYYYNRADGRVKRTTTSYNASSSVIARNNAFFPRPRHVRTGPTRTVTATRCKLATIRITYFTRTNSEPVLRENFAPSRSHLLTAFRLLLFPRCEFLREQKLDSTWFDGIYRSSLPLTSFHLLPLMRKNSRSVKR